MSMLHILLLAFRLIGGILLPCAYKMNYVNLQRRYVNMRRIYVKKLVDIIMLHE